jgi:hypothetical protein
MCVYLSRAINGASNSKRNLFKAFRLLLYRGAIRNALRSDPSSGEPVGSWLEQARLLSSDTLCIKTGFCRRTPLSDSACRYDRELRQTARKMPGGSDLALTPEFLGLMLGARRASPVTSAASIAGNTTDMCARAGRFICVERGSLVRAVSLVRGSQPDSATAFSHRLGGCCGGWSHFNG